MVTEPHTTDSHNFGEDCPDCGSMCADALIDLVEWVTAKNKHKTTCKGRVAALIVVTGRMTSKEAAAWYGVTVSMVHYNLKELAQKFGLRLKNGKVI